MQKLVYGDGPMNAKIVIVGEAPSEQEQLVGKPLVGKPNERLNQALQSANIPRYNCYVTNVIKTNPIKNDVTYFFELNMRNQTVKKTTPEYQAFEAALYEEINLINPNLIIALGQTAMFALTRKFGIQQWRGSVIPGVDAIQNRKVLCTYHPKDTIFQHNLSWIFVIDIKKATQESKYPEIRRRKRNFLLEPSFEEACIYLKNLRFCSPISFDIEIVNEELYCLAFAKDPSNAICIPFLRQDRTHYYTPAQEAELMRLISEVLYDYEVIKIGQNISFDVTFLLRKYGIITLNMHDTMVAQGLLWPEFPKGLDFITSLYTDQPYYKDEGKKWFKIGGTQESFFIYNCLDALVCLEAFPKIEHELEVQGNLDAYLKQIELIEPLAAMQYRGIRMDVEGLRDLSEKAKIRMSEIKEELTELFGQAININSTKQLQDYFYKKKGIKPYISRGTGNATLDADALKRIARRGYKEAELLLEYRQLSKLDSTYYQMKLDPDNRMRCSFNPVRTKSGRLSSSKTIFDTGGNQQNQPPIMKRAMLADEKYLMVNVDLAKAENHIVAFLGPDENMIMAFEKGLDLHRLTAGLIFGKSLDEVSDEPGSCSLASGKYSERFWGKKANHGLNYGFSYKNFGLQYEIPEAEAKFIVERYHAAYPGVRRFHRWVQNMLKESRCLVDLFGKKRIFFDRLDENTYKEAYSQIPQSTVAHIINNYGIIPLHNNPDVELLNQVHDSILFQMRFSLGATRIAQILWGLKKSLAVEMHWNSFYFSLGSDFGIGPNAYDMLSLDMSDFTLLVAQIEQYLTSASVE